MDATGGVELREAILSCALRAHFVDPVFEHTPTRSNQSLDRVRVFLEKPRFSRFLEQLEARAASF
jgi:hypothetical protein